MFALRYDYCDVNYDGLIGDDGNDCDQDGGACHKDDSHNKTTTGAP